MGHGRYIIKTNFIVIFFVLTHVAVIAQFTHRLEILGEKTFASQSDNILIQGQHIDYKRTGGGFSTGMKYNFRKLPMALYLGYDYADFSNYSIKSDIDIHNNSNELEIKSIDLDVQYLFLKRSIIKPYIFIGVNYNMIDHISTNLRFSNIPGREEYIKVDDIWYNDSNQAKSNSPGIKAGAGLNIKITDKIGINGSVRFRFITQNKSIWIGEKVSAYSCSIGVYYRFFKDKNIISL